MKNNNNIWRNESNFDNWETRRHRFTEEMLPVFNLYLRLKSNYNILDAGCGTGVLTRYLAGGLDEGKITGFDISSFLVDFGNKQIEKRKLNGKAKLIVADGYELPFDDNFFDAVTNYTYLGVLSEPDEGFKELIRVCKPGGSISAISAIPDCSFEWKGNYHFKWNDRIIQLDRKQEDIYRQIRSINVVEYSTQWPNCSFPLMFTTYGLIDVSIYTVSHCFSFNDERWAMEYRKEQIESGISNKIRYISERRKMPEFKGLGMTDSEFSELIGLLEEKKQYLVENIDTDNSWEWSAGMSFIVVGNKPI